VNLGISAGLLSAALLGGMLLMLELGRWMAARRLRQDPEGARAGLGTVEGAIFGLLGLLVAFTFSGASSRFEARRQLIVEEANDIGTAYLRIDLLAPASQPALRESFRRYLDARIEMYRRFPDLKAVEAANADAIALQGQIWSQVVSACRQEGAQPAAAILMLPAVNAMIDITTTRAMALRMHPPPTVFAMLLGLMLVASLLAGYEMAGSRRRSWLHVAAFAVILSASFYVIVDLEFPRLGLIQVRGFDQALLDVRRSMK
jgi:hypothetical protein